MNATRIFNARLVNEGRGFNEKLACDGMALLGEPVGQRLKFHR